MACSLTWNIQKTKDSSENQKRAPQQQKENGISVKGNLKKEDRWNERQQTRNDEKQTPDLSMPPQSPSPCETNKWTDERKQDKKTDGERSVGTRKVMAPSTRKFKEPEETQ